MTVNSASAGDRLDQLIRLLRSEGPRRVVNRLRNRLADGIRPSDPTRLPISSAHFSSADRLDSSGWTFPPPLRWSPGSPLRIAWICTPPAPGSGGHTTIFRMIEALERAGHQLRYLHTGRARVVSSTASRDGTSLVAPGPWRNSRLRFRDGRCPCHLRHRVDHRLDALSVAVSRRTLLLYSGLRAFFLSRWERVHAR